jgi:chloramphenicol 3-O-phosphotransferase
VPVYLITGILAAGKSTVAQALAQALPRSVHVRGDVFRRMVVSGRVDMGPDAGPEALAQLALRYRLAAQTALTYRASGFTPVVQDVILGDILVDVAALYAAVPLRLVVLCPAPAVVREREQGRSKVGYGAYTPEDLHAALMSGTPRMGLWLDTTALSVEQTVQAILHHAWDNVAAGTGG